MAGQLRGFDGSKYTLEVGTGGVISLDATIYECLGTPCSALGTPLTAPTGTSTFVIESANAAGKPITIEGSAVIGLDLMPALIRAYAADMGGTVKQLVGTNSRETGFRLTDGRGAEFASLDLKRYGSEAAFQSLRNGSAVIGVSSRQITTDETQALVAAQPQVKSSDYEHVLGLDGLVVIVPSGSAATSLSVDAIARIFAGTVTDWSGVGLPAGRINLYVTSERSGSADALADLVLKPRGLALSPSSTRVTDEAELSDAVSRDPNAIGITSFAFVRNARALDITTPCGIVAKPTTFAVKSEEYPLSRRLYVYTAGQPKDPGAQELVRFMVSRKAQPVIRDAAFVDQSIERVPFEGEQARILASLAGKSPDAPDVAQARQLIAEILGAQRLSVTFRFAFNAVDLDAKARGDLARLAELLKSPEMAGKTVMFIGFTDAAGPAWLNQALSLKRAEEVRDAVLRMNASLTSAASFSALGFGPAAPVVCNQGRRSESNRRVEVWVRDSKASAAPAAVAAAPQAAAGQLPAVGKPESPPPVVKTARKRRHR